MSSGQEVSGNLASGDLTNGARPERGWSQRDRITLTGLGAVGYHGVLDQERKDGQPFFVDLVLYLPLREAGRTDDLTRTVHYGVVAEQVTRILEGDPVNLLETLAEKIAGALLEGFPVEAVEVTVHKPKAPIEVTFADISVSILREREEPS